MDKKVYDFRLFVDCTEMLGTADGKHKIELEASRFEFKSYSKTILSEENIVKEFIELSKKVIRNFPMGSYYYKLYSHIFNEIVSRIRKREKEFSTLRVENQEILGMSLVNDTYTKVFKLDCEGLHIHLSIRKLNEKSNKHIIQVDYPR